MDILLINLRCSIMYTRFCFTLETLECWNVALIKWLIDIPIQLYFIGPVQAPIKVLVLTCESKKKLP